MKTIKINENAKQLFGADKLQYSKTSFSAYKRVIETDRKNAPLLVLQSPLGKNPFITNALNQIFFHICDDEKQAKEVASKVAAHLFTSKMPLRELELSTCEMVTAAIPGYGAKIQQKLSSRSSTIFTQLAPFIDGETVLDVGAGNGKVAEKISKELGKNVFLVDVMDYNTTSLPLHIFDGTKMPAAIPNSDTSIVSVVFHHADSPIELLEEVIRVTNKRIVVIESVYFNEQHRELNVILDWLYNRVFNDGINCPFNFQTPAGWVSTFKKYGLKIAASKDLGIDQPLVPEYHWLFALDVGK